jgi:two-component system phosphate regulon sensor histidine kinase PhoR
VENAAFDYHENSDDANWLWRALAGENIGVTHIDGAGIVTSTLRVSDPKGAYVGDAPEVIGANSSGLGNDTRYVNYQSVAFVAIRLPDGSALRLSMAAPTWLNAILPQLPLMISITLLFSAGLYLLYRWAHNAMQIYVTRVSQVLEAFAEGRFGERILGVPNRDRQDVARINDLAERIEAQLIRQRNRNRVMNAVMYEMQNGFIAVDGQLRVALITPVAKQLLGITGSSEGMPISEASKDARLEQAFADAMRQDGIFTRDLSARTGVGRARRPLRLYVSAMRQDDVKVGALALVEDITELKRLEEVRNDFVANVSHELKTPLTSIRGFVETLQAGAIENPERAHKFLNIIMLESERLTRLINDILVITKMESGKDKVRNARVRLDQMAYDVADMLRIHAREKQVTVYAREPGEPVYIWGSPDRVEQMLINLIENGIKYNKPGGSVTIKVFSSGESVQLLISDTGIGIKEEHMPRLFERFYRVDKGRSRNMGGTGLGLAIVKHIIKGLGGMVEVYSKPTDGTEFLVTLPKYSGELEEENLEIEAEAAERSEA